MKIINKSAWIHVVNRKMLFFRNEDKDVFYLPGGRREADEDDEGALIREIHEEAKVELRPETIQLVQHYTAEAHNRADTVVEIRGYFADFEGKITAGSEIAEINWFDSNDKARIASAAYPILDWLKEQDLID